MDDDDKKLSKLKMEEQSRTNDPCSAIYDSGYQLSPAKIYEESRLAAEPSGDDVNSICVPVVIEDQDDETNSQTRVGAIFIEGLSAPAEERNPESSEYEDVVSNVMVAGAEPVTGHHPQDTVMAYAVDHDDSEDAEEAVLVIKDITICHALISNRWLKILVILSFIAVILSVSLSFLIRPDSSPRRTQNDSEPSELKKNTRKELFTSVAKELSGEQVIADPNSAQFKALEWLNTLDKATVPFGDQERAKQRYAATVLFFSTGGNTTWIHQNRFLQTEKHECDWNTIEVGTGRTKGIECKHAFNTDITMLNLSKMNMTGTIPKEISTLPLLVLDFSENKNMNGTIPKEISRLSKVEEIYLNDMDLSGSIPDEFSTLTALKSVRLYGNERLQQNFEPFCQSNTGDFVEVTCAEPTRKACSCCTCVQDY